MRTHEATAEIFYTAFRALSKKEREEVVERLLRDKEFAEDLYDIALIASRKNEPSRPFEEFLAEEKRRRRR